MQLILNGVISNSTSYGISTINTILSLEKNNCEVQTLPIGGRADWLKTQNIQPSINRGKNFGYNNPCLRIYHEFDIAPHYGRGKSIGFPIFEKTKFSDDEIHQMKSLDMLFVTCKWAKQIIEDNGILIPTKVVPLGVDVNTFSPNTTNNRPFTFFFPGKFEIRKGFDEVMNIFEKAFTINDDFRLIFLPTNLFIGKENDDWMKFLMSSPLSSKIQILPRIEQHTDVAEIYRQTDCVVSFSRAEGFNLPLLEGLACGCSIVATNYSAHTEYLTPLNSYLVDIDELEPALDGKWFLNPDNYWASLTERVKNELAERLKEVYKNGHTKNEEGITTAKQFTWDNTARLIIDNLEN